MPDKEVFMLYYASPEKGEAKRGVKVWEKPDFNALAEKGMVHRDCVTHDFIKAKVRLYAGAGYMEPNVRVNGVVYHGDVLFVARDEKGHARSLTAQEIQAIKLVTQRI